MIVPVDCGCWNGLSPGFTAGYGNRADVIEPTPSPPSSSAVLTPTQRRQQAPVVEHEHRDRAAEADHEDARDEHGHEPPDPVGRAAHARDDVQPDRGAVVRDVVVQRSSRGSRHMSGTGMRPR